MKQTNKMSRAICQLEKMYNTINTEKFDGILPTPIITVQTKPGTWGHCSKTKVWHSKNSEQYEMNIAAESVDGIIEEIIDTLIHEMIHLYCRENNIQEVSRGGTYHNKEFKKLAEEKGLVVIKTEKYGYNTVGTGNDYLTKYALDHDWTEINIGRGTAISLPMGVGTINPTTGEIINQGTKAPSSTRKYRCPKCGNSVRATKNVNIGCLDCNVKMEVCL